MEQKKCLATSEPASVEAELLDLELDTGLRERGPAGTQLPPPRLSQSTRQSESTSRTSMSCAVRETSVEDCSRQRFIVWAAIKRNRSVRMAPSDRLCCPLVRCRERFEDHESMLQHLAKCQHLTSGEYICYDCMKVEKFNDKKCRCCLGHPTKRRRVINMARSFFSNIGHRSRKGDARNGDQDDLAMPPPYESLHLDAQPHSDQLEQPHIELNGREIFELDSRPMIPTSQLDSINYEPQTAPDPEQLNMFNRIPDPTFASVASPLTPYEGLSGKEKDSTIPPNQAYTTGSHRPSLALDTHIDHYRSVPRFKYLSPSSSLRSTRSSQGISPITPWSSSSGGTGNWTMASSIETALTSPASASSPTSHLLAPQVEHAFINPKDTKNCHGGADEYMLDALPELPGDNPYSSQIIPRGLSDPLLFSFDPKDNYSWMSSVDTTLSLGTSVNMVFTDANPNLEAALSDAPAPGLSVRTLIDSAWSALQEHVSTSLMKVALIPDNPLARRFQDESAATVFHKGLSSLRYMLEGDDPHDPLDYLCFVHTIYAFSLVIHEGDIMARCNRLFKQALAYRGFLAPSYSQTYSQVVSTIWQSTPEGQSQEQEMVSLGRSSSSKGKEPEYRMSGMNATGADPLIVMGQNFLDDVETAVISGGEHNLADNIALELWSTHMAGPLCEPSQTGAFAITADYIVQSLIQKFHDSDRLLSNLRLIVQRVKNNVITNIRRLELEVLRAGKNSMNSTDLFDEFIPQVRGLCDSLYSQTGFIPRTKYHMLGLSLIESFVQSLASESQQRGCGATMSGTLPANVPDPIDEFLESLSQTFEETNDMDHEFLEEISRPAPNVVGSAATNSHPTAPNIFGLHHGSPSSQVAAPMGTAPAYQSRSVPPNSPYPTNAILTSSSEPPPHTNNPGAAVLPGHGKAAAATATIVEPSGGALSSVATSNISSAGGTPAPAPVPMPTRPAVAVAAAAAASSSSSKVEADDSCEVCGYRPKGDPQWFKGSMAKHKKLQHSPKPPVMYRCPFPGCTSAYRNRPDNLRQHQIEKGHFVAESGSGSGSGGGDAGEGRESGGNGSGEMAASSSSSGTTNMTTATKRPSKKRKKGVSS